MNFNLSAYDCFYFSWKEVWHINIHFKFSHSLKQLEKLQQLEFVKCGWLCNLCNRTVFRLIQEQCLEHVIVEGWVVAAGPFTVWTKVQLQDLWLHDLTWRGRKRTSTSIFPHYFFFVKWIKFIFSSNFYTPHSISQYEKCFVWNDCKIINSKKTEISGAQVFTATPSSTITASSLFSLGSCSNRLVHFVIKITVTTHGTPKAMKKTLTILASAPFKHEIHSIDCPRWRIGTNSVRRWSRCGRRKQFLESFEKLCLRKVNKDNRQRP